MAGTPNVFKRNLEDKPLTEFRTLHKSDILPGNIEQRAFEAGLFAIYFGLAADRPNGTTHCKAYFATDTFVLSLWTGSAWKTVTLA